MKYEYFYIILKIIIIEVNLLKNTKFFFKKMFYVG